MCSLPTSWKGRLDKSATYMFTKIGNKNCKVIVDNESCINAVSSKLTEKVGLEDAPHLHPYKVSWINSTILEVKQQWLVPMEFDFYKDKI